jgi:hypothetical protein
VLGRNERPHDGLIERLRENEDKRWVFEMIETVLPPDARDSIQRLLDPSTPLEALEALKRLGKRAFKEKDEDSRHAGVFAYFASSAAALVHHDARISTAPDEYLADAWRALAAELPGGWERIFHAAAQKLPLQS